MEENFHLLDQIALKIAISADMTPYAIGKDPLNAISQLTSFSGLSTFLDNIIVYYGEGEYFLTSHGMLSDSSFLEGYLKSDELYDTIVNAQEVMVYNANKFGRRQRWDHILYIGPAFHMGAAGGRCVHFFAAYRRTAENGTGLFLGTK